MTCLTVGVTAAASNPAPPTEQAVLKSITAAQLRGDLSFLSSDALQGRFTPSPGLDVAAEFIASQFRAAGLKPGGDQDFFQIARMVDRSMPKMQSPLTARRGDEALEVSQEVITVSSATEAAKVEHVPIIVFPAHDLTALNRADVAGKAVLVDRPAFENMKESEAIAAYHQMLAFDQRVTSMRAAVELVVTDHLKPVSSQLLTEQKADAKQTPVVEVKDARLQAWLRDPKQADRWTVSLNIPAPQDRPVVVKNVIGILPGSDSKLKDTAVLLTAHYDHIGTTETAGRMAMPSKSQDTNDHIYNGANDDGSGTVSVIEIARALAKLNPHPKRTLVFMTFFGEERGELGSKFYGEHPIFPISKTVADVNLEQIGRTDEIRDGKLTPQVNAASLTGFDYSDVTGYLVGAGKQLGIRVFKDPEASDPYFTRSDNDALAQQGVPAHTICVAFDYPDYHGLDDEWRKIDYDNMARVDRMIALALINIADSASAPQWNVSNPNTAPFREAQQKWKQSADGSNSGAR